LSRLETADCTDISLAGQFVFKFIEERYDMLAKNANIIEKKKRKMPLVQDKIVNLHLKGGKLPLLIALF
jgi:hypothetical protein